MSVKKSGCPVKKRQPLFLRATPVNAGITGVRPIFCLVFFDEEGFAGVGTNHRLCPPASDACPEVRLNFQLFPPANHHTLFHYVAFVWVVVGDAAGGCGGDGADDVIKESVAL